jgi:hypothetical protein
MLTALLGMALVITLLTLPGPLGATDANVRAGLVLNFIRFTDWPALANDGSNHLNICVARGDTRMASAMSALENRSVNERTIKVSTVSRPNEARDCQVLYLPAELNVLIADFVQVVQGEAVLTISDAPDFVDSQGMIGLRLVTSRYQFEINNKVVRNSDLRLNPQLLRLASRVL